MEITFKVEKEYRVTLYDESGKVVQHKIFNSEEKAIKEGKRLQKFWENSPYWSNPHTAPPKC